VTIPREQPNAPAVALNDQALAVVLDFVDPFRPVRNLGAARRDAGLEYRLTHSLEIVGGDRIASDRRAYAYWS
jgi:hypothetical protein